MNFLQLCQYAHRRIGGGNDLPGTAPTTVTGQSGYLYEIVTSVQDAYESILNEQDSWTFLKRQGSLGLSQGTREITMDGLFVMTLDDVSRAAFYPIGSHFYIANAVNGPAGPYGSDPYDCEVLGTTSDIPNDTFTLSVRFVNPEALAAQSQALPTGANAAVIASYENPGQLAQTTQIDGFSGLLYNGYYGNIPNFNRIAPFTEGPGQRFVLLNRAASPSYGQTPCFYVPYQSWRGVIDRATVPTGSSLYFTVQPSGTIEFSAIADQDYVVTTDYYITNPVLVADSDVPVLPPQYHKAIAWRAALDWAGVQGQPQKFGFFSAEYDRIMNNMRASCLPEVVLSLDRFYSSDCQFV